MSKVNDKQVGGDHYKCKGKTEHWDFAAEHNYDYFQGAITKYVHRWRNKGGIQDLEKALHYLEKYIEVEKDKCPPHLEEHQVDELLLGPNLRTEIPRCAEPKTSVLGNLTEED